MHFPGFIWTSELAGQSSGFARDAFLLETENTCPLPLSAQFYSSTYGLFKRNNEFPQMYSEWWIKSPMMHTHRDQASRCYFIVERPTDKCHVCWVGEARFFLGNPGPQGICFGLCRKAEWLLSTLWRGSSANNDFKIEDLLPEYSQQLRIF